jgi:hypothetical protein
MMALAGISDWVSVGSEGGFGHVDQSLTPSSGRQLVRQQRGWTTGDRPQVAGGNVFLCLKHYPTLGCGVASSTCHRHPPLDSKADSVQPRQASFLAVAISLATPPSLSRWPRRSFTSLLEQVKSSHMTLPVTASLARNSSMLSRS